MVRSYLKYDFTRSFGVVATASSNTVWTPETGARSTGAGKAYVGANEEVLCWDVKKGELLSRWRAKDTSSQVTAIAQSRTDPDIYAVGHADGSIRLWDARIASVLITFNGHRSAITVLTFDQSGVRLASGARDTDVIVWDLVAEVGLFKLRGHKDQITGISFLDGSLQPQEEVAITNEGDASQQSSETYLLSTSKDALVKLWDVTSQYCVETHVTQSNGECWALAVSPDNSGCITAGIDGEIRIWSLDLEALNAHAVSLDKTTDRQFLIDRGTITRQTGRERTTGVFFHPKANFIMLHGAEKAVELWRIRTPDEVKKSLARKRRRKREKAGDGDTEMADGEQGDEDGPTDVKEVFVPHTIVRTGGKVRSVDWAGGRPSKALQLIASTTNNQIEFYSVSVKKSSTDETIEYNRLHAVELPGHRADVRSLSLSSDDRLLASASSGSLKIWNVQTESCIRTLDCGYALCSAFLPGDKIVLIGTKAGTLELFDIASSTLIDTIEAHSGAVWALKVHPDGKSVVTGSADKSAKFWTFSIVQEEIPGSRRTTPRLKLTHSRTLKLNDDILSLCFSPDNGRLLAASTLDNTVKVFFTDSLKLFLTLYGHKLPVLNISISSDSKLIATCSADKTVRIWGLDFGDCHKTFLASDESVMAVAFPPHPISRDDAHLLFSASKDGALKTWDADRFEHVQTLRPAHAGEVWALAISRTADFAVSASHDKSIRVWRQSDEPLFLEEERERDLEEHYDANLAAQLDRDAADEDALRAATGEDAVDAAPASKQTGATLTAGERIVEALTLATADLQAAAEAQAAGTAAPPRHPLLAFKDVAPERYLLDVLESVAAPALDDALLLLSFGLVGPVLTFAARWLQQRMNVALACRVLFAVLRVHHRQIVASAGQLRAQMQAVGVQLDAVLRQEKDVLGFNLAACKVLSSRIADTKVASIEDVLEGTNGAVVRSGKKRGFVNVA